MRHLDDAAILTSCWRFFSGDSAIRFIVQLEDDFGTRYAAEVVQLALRFYVRKRIDA